MQVIHHPVVGSVPYSILPDGRLRLDKEWARRNLTTVFIPQLASVPTYGGSFSGKVVWYKGAAGQLTAAWREIEKSGLLGRVLFWGGSYNPRLIRGSKSTPSNHAFGTAFDINPQQNPLGKPPAPAGSHGSVQELVPIFKKHGFRWGGDFSRPDGMHFEIIYLKKAV